MLNPLLASFDQQPALIAPSAQNQLQASLVKAYEVQQRIEAAANAPMMTDDFWYSPDDWRAQFRPYVVRDGILHIPVKGILLAEFPWALGSWATGYVYIRRALERGLADPNVRGIAWVVNSFGGHVAECFDLGDQIFAARGRKPMRAFAHEAAYSAAYLIASSSERLDVARTGGVGSIGTVTVHIDISKAVEDAGYKVTFIHFGKHKVDGNPYEALPAGVKERIQARIDEFGEMFVSTVARNRAIDVQAVRDTEALSYTATQALPIGLADSIGAFDDEIAAFAADLSLNDDEDEKMNEEEKRAAAQAAIDAARVEGATQGAKDGARAERDRIKAIMESPEGVKRPIAARAAAFDTDMSVEGALAFIAKLPEEKQPEAKAEQPADPNAPKGKDGAAKDFNAAMDKSEHPEAGAPAAADGGKDDKPQGSRAERAFALAGKPKKAA